MTGYGFTGPWTDRGTVFADKAAGASAPTRFPSASRYRYEYRVNTVIRALLLALMWGRS